MEEGEGVGGKAKKKLAHKGTTNKNFRGGPNGPGMMHKGYMRPFAARGALLAACVAAVRRAIRAAIGGHCTPPTRCARLACCQRGGDHIEALPAR